MDGCSLLHDLARDLIHVIAAGCGEMQAAGGILLLMVHCYHGGPRELKGLSG